MHLSYYKSHSSVGLSYALSVCVHSASPGGHVVGLIVCLFGRADAVWRRGAEAERLCAWPYSSTPCMISLYVLKASKDGPGTSALPTVCRPRFLGRATAPHVNSDPSTPTLMLLSRTSLHRPDPGSP